MSHFCSSSEPQHKNPYRVISLLKLSLLSNYRFVPLKLTTLVTWKNHLFISYCIYTENGLEAMNARRDLLS